ncbi:DUF1295 domain-containing protein [Pseudonocardiaceae bacterium YIM PH 21723]|nr:DUF1295 domain-containing protein [Pseudonocardiaceae bacterium YIM PH 21723]
MSQRFLKRLVQALPFLALLAIVLAQPAMREFALVNVLVQLVLFLVIANIPAYRTGLMSYVDVAWPWGLVAIGVQTLIFGHPLDCPLTAVTAIIYLLIGGRMGLWGASLMFKQRPTQDLQRYRYQRRRWEKHGYQSEQLSLQYEISLQGLANMSFCALPALLIVSAGDTLGWVEVIAIALWSLSFVLETVADLQKAAFGKTHRGVTCDVGLWKYSRHPNYFFQWMQWNALILLALPTVEVHTALGIATLIGLLGISYVFYVTLVYATGAVPAEYYSRLSRPDYAEYQRTTNRFFPGRNRTAT